MPSPVHAFSAFEEALRAQGAPPMVIETFRHHYDLLRAGHSGLIGERDIEAVTDLPELTGLPDLLERAGGEALERLVVIKLNGGLGTSMGLARAKSLLPVKDGLTFLDIIVRQALALREQTGAAVPLVFMNSFATEDDTRQALNAYPELAVDDLPLTFLQNKVPKIIEQDHSLPPQGWGEHGWCPPGHGDIYTALHASGLLDRLLDRGFTHAFVSNADNLGATVDTRILGHVASGVPFLMEVARRTAADRKGGHLARRPDGRLLLREVAQTPKEDLEAFQDMSRHGYFNTNSLWIDLRALRALLDDSGGIFRLPLIRNRKTIDPRDADSPRVVQLETAMGAAIELFEGSQALCVPRARFAPVKLCSDLLALWSDACALDAGFHIVTQGASWPVVVLADPCYQRIDDMRARFPYGAPSLRLCERFEVAGDVTFGQGVKVRGRVRVTADTPSCVDDHRVLEGDVAL
ncbi:MAG: UTP--glucose-1-phosphate uridylyltransferase [Proteobacteria bacterium]|nr:UTP--glucose-1-phosphate uridylyltransferase [Pseudomonadota bacterium]